MSATSSIATFLCVCVGFLNAYEQWNGHNCFRLVSYSFRWLYFVFTLCFSSAIQFELTNFNLCANIFEYGCCVHMKSLGFICTHVIIIMSREKLRMNEKRVWHEKKTHFVSTTTDLPPAWRRNKKWNTNRRTAYKIIKRSYINENILNRLIQWAYYNNII